MARKQIKVSRVVDDTEWYCDECHKQIPQNELKHSWSCDTCGAYTCSKCNSPGSRTYPCKECVCCTEIAKSLRAELDMLDANHKKTKTELTQRLEAEQERLKKERDVLVFGGCAHCGKPVGDTPYSIGLLHFCGAEHMLEHDRAARANDVRQDGGQR